VAEETKELLSCEPERLGHATFLDEEAKEVVLARRTCIEICLTSNLLCVILSPSFLLREFECWMFVVAPPDIPLADANRCSDSRITTFGITLLGTTPSPSVYVLPFFHTFSRITHFPFLSYVRSVLVHQPTDR
jgi:hypothetical protein